MAVLRFTFALLAVVTAGAPEAAADAAVPAFVEETTAAGLGHVYGGGGEFMVGGGVAAFDCDGDGRPELYLAGGAGPGRLYHNTGAPGGALRFTAVADAGLDAQGVIGAYPLDVDDDGITDLALLRLGPDLLMRGRGGCRFEAANAPWGFTSDDRWTTAFSATWERDRPWPTLAFGDFIRRRKTIESPRDCGPNRLYRPKAAGGYGPPAALAPGHCPLSMLFSDWNRDGVADLRISNDREFHIDGAEQLVRLAPGAPPVFLGPDDGWPTVAIFGMGIASHDVTGDGWPDYYLTNMGANRLETRSGTAAGRPVFEDRAAALGIAAARPFTGAAKPSTAWHAEFGDVNNDGWADLLVVKGNVKKMTENAAEDPNNLLVRVPGGGFVETAAAAGVLSAHHGRAGALVDLNGDGRLDLVVSNRDQPAQVWRNVTPPAGRNWITVEPRQPAPNRRAVGAWVEVRTASHTQRREHTVGGGHAGGQWGPLHVGLGPHASAEVRVQWPDGRWSRWQAVAANRRHVIRRE